MDGPGSKGDQTRAALLEAAFELFSQQGFHGTSMRQIADRVGLTPGSLYNHFAGKDELFLAVVKAYHPLSQIAPLLAEAQGDDLADYIQATARQFGQAMREQPGLLNLALVELIELNGRHMPDLIHSFQPQVAVFIQRLAAAQEELRPIPLYAAFRAFLGLLLAYELTDQLLQAAFEPGSAELGELDDFIDIYLHGILQDGILQDGVLQAKAAGEENHG